MKHKDKICGCTAEWDDGDKSTEDITELHGKLAEEADEEMVQFALKILKGREFRVYRGDKRII